MEFRIADTFTDSLTRLTGQDQKAIKLTAFDLQMNPTSPGMSFHRIDRARDPNFWSVRASRDLRVIVHKTDASLLLCYADHHDDAYAWAERRKIQRHPRTGAAQLVEIRETVREIAVPKYVEAETPSTVQPPLFADVSPDDLLSYGVPDEWLEDVRSATEDSLFDLAEHLPKEATEALLDLATGVTPQISAVLSVEDDPFEHPDAQRRFRVMTDVEELERALDFPWDKWTVFLHPMQRHLVERDYSGPARVSGSAGTGKTIVALHRAVHLTRTHPESRVLLTTFSDPLASALRTRLRRLIGNEPRLGERLEVESISAVGRRLYEANFGPAKLASISEQQEFLRSSAEGLEGSRFTDRFLWAEWAQVVDDWQLRGWEEYRDVSRLGRKTRLAESQRAALWSVFETVRGELEKRSMLTLPGVLSRLTEHFSDSHHLPFEFAVVDEAQDVSVSELQFLAALGGGRPNSLFFAGDLGQRIFQQPFSWKALGVEIQGRSRTLRVNYRTSHQIRRQADRLLGPELSDVDGNTEDRRGTISVFNGPPPVVQVYETADDETTAVAQWIIDRLADGCQPHEVAIFVRSAAELPRAQSAVELAGIPAMVLDGRTGTKVGSCALATMHLAKGLEFKAVVVMACDDEIIPLQERIESVADDSDLEEIYQTERHLLYVACTRARDHLMVSGVDPASEFLDDLQGSDRIL